MNPNQIIWEVTYRDGSTVSESSGVKYGAIDRHNVQSVRLISLEQRSVIVELHVDGSDQFFYRRRTKMIQGGGSIVTFILGVWPDFALEFDTQNGQLAEIPVDIDPLPFERLSHEDQITIV